MNNSEIQVEQDPLNEYSTHCIASLAFPTLFPDSKGDPTNEMTVRQISEMIRISFASKLNHLIKFDEK